jgi:uncharacterized protein YgiB involved in biofilm formation
LRHPEEEPVRRTLTLALLAGSAFAGTPTYNHDIAPLLYENCAGCHRPGQVAPFSLLTYQDAAKRRICGAPKRPSTRIIMESWSLRNWLHSCNFSSGA